MKIYTRYIVASVLKTGFAVALFASAVMLGVDLFRNLDMYLAYSVPSGTIVRLTLLYWPQALLFAIGPAFLFSVTYFLSMLHASNEIIAVLNSSIKYSEVIRPILITGLFLSVFFFLFNEGACIPATSSKTAMTEAATSGSTDDGNNYNIAMSDMTEGYMVYAGTYVNSTKSLYNVTLVSASDDSVLRIDAEYARWDSSNDTWTFFNAWEYTEGGPVHKDSVTVSEMKLEPEMFVNMSDKVDSMPLAQAGRYLRRIKSVDVSRYRETAAYFYDRILNCLTPLVMVVIACSMNYRIKKNVLFISIIFSIAIAVVYFVVRMMTVMMAKQGMIAPYMGTLVPFIIILILGTVLRNING